MMRPVRIGNGCGFWGDNLDAPVDLARDGRLDYLTLEYLAELTMSILSLIRSRDRSLGYATDFIDVLERLTPFLRDQPNLRIITNAGGVNPGGCAERARDVLDKAALPMVRIGVVSGDSLFDLNFDKLLGSGHRLTNLDTGAALAEIRSRIQSANAYLGAAPIVDALNQGARIV